MYGALVRRARVRRGLTQRQLADLAGIDQPNLSAIETGRRMPSAETFHRLLFACGFELVAAAGDLELALPPPEDDTLPSGPAELHEPLDMSEESRARELVAVLQLAEVILRSR